ncbi:ribonuclease MC-like isoform X2 [Prunus avium]|uniref:Ribonuclease MC-like isoform X2 n=1 Tax=Prunus avium TaxID=42229 RepID=A0A6P5RG56_PRUAV|nr:ribonuclease MC-like isoform X2 [Prunus avium]
MAMLKSSLSFLVLGFAFFLCFIISAGSYVYFQFVQQWPPTTCRVQKKCSKPRPLQNFTIHGLWPSNYSNPTMPSNCNGSRFKKELLSPRMQSKLKISWPNVVSSNDTKFWESEWNKHGTCSEQTLNQVQYFEISHEMWNSFNITDILKNASIVPHPTQTWKYSDIVSAIQSKTQRTPLLRCKTDPAHPNANTQLLHEVVFCYGYNAIKQIDCNRTAGCKNQVNILFP